MNSEKPILQLMDEFLAQHDINENSRKKYRDNLHVFIGWLTRNGDVRDPSKADVLAYKKWLQDSGKSPYTIDNYLSPVRNFFRYLAECGIHSNIGKGVKSPRSYGYSKDYLRPNEVALLMKAINRTSPWGLRDYAIINLMVRTGMRCIEVERANVKDLTKEEDQWILYIQGKGRYSKDRVIGITDVVVAPIAKYIDANNLQENSPMFINHSYISSSRITTLTISKLIKKYMRLAGINSSRKSAHSLRHTFATTALNEGADILAVQAILGHQKLETTMIYQRALEAERGRKGTAVRLLDNAFKLS